MNDPRRLLEGDGNAFEKALLRSAAADEPETRAGLRTLAALGLSAGVAASTTAIATATATAAVTKIGTKGALAAVAQTLVSHTAVVSVAKWAGIFVIGSMGTWGVATSVSDTEPESIGATEPLRPATQQVVSLAQVVRPAPRPISLTDPAEVGRPTEAVANAEDNGPTVPRATFEPAPARQGAKTNELALELAALDSAYRAMRADQPQQALRALAAYQRRFPAGTLRPEARVLRIQALARAGDRVRAQAMTRQFLRQRPSSPYTQRLQSVVKPGF